MTRTAAAELSKAVETVVIESARKDARIAELEAVLVRLRLTFNGQSSRDWQDALAAAFRAVRDRA